MGLDSVELIMEVETAFSIRITNKEAEKIRTVGDLYSWVWSHVENQGANRKEVEDIINQIIIKKVGVDLEEISPEKSFTDDLGID